MFVFLSKLLPLFIYPLGLACLLLAAALFIRRSARAKNILIATALLLLFVGGNRWVATYLTRSLEWRYLPQQNYPQVDAIVVLGGGTDPASYPRIGAEVNGAGDRVLYAAQLYKQGKAPHLLLSGGYISFLSIRPSTPAQEMAEILTRMDIPESALWLQNQSQNTAEDALYSSQMLKEKGISRVILVTSAMHMPRSVALFKQQGIEVIPAPTDYSVAQEDLDNLIHATPSGWLINLLPNAGSLSSTTTALKEYIGLLAYRLQGWL